LFPVELNKMSALRTEKLRRKLRTEKTR